jgi:HNH endonuclease
MGNGYGMITVGGVRWAAHRYSYTQLVGPIPEGLDLDHLCRNRPCCNPAHLEPVTRSENLKRGNVGVWAKEHNGKKTHCPSGHEYSGDNLYIHPRGSRCCRACTNARQRERTRRGLKWVG